MSDAQEAPIHYIPSGRVHLFGLTGLRLAEAILNGFFYGGETLMIALLGTGVGRSTASRAFSERTRRWTSRFEFRMPQATAPAVLDALDHGDWKVLADLPRVSSFGNA